MILSYHKQTFTAPQTFYNLQFEDDVVLYSYINGLKLTNLYYETIWKTTAQPVNFDVIAFENIIIEQSLQLQGPLSGIRVPNDLILRNSTEIQILSKYITFNGNVKVYDTLTIQDTINSINYSKICELISSNDLTPYGLQVIGNAKFDKDPTVDYLNKLPLNDLFENVWFVDDEYINFIENIEFRKIVIRDAALLTVSEFYWNLFELILIHFFVCVCLCLCLGIYKWI